MNISTEEFAVMKNEILHIKDDVKEIKKMLLEREARFKEDFVTKEEFTTVKALVYGFVSIVLSMVVGAIVYLVI